MPCLNEAETLAVCVDKARAALAENDIAGEVVVADNGSTDGSQAIATEHGARVVPGSAARLRRSAQRRHPGRARQVCADGRRRRQLRVRAHPALPGRAAQRGGPGDGQSLSRRHRAQGDAAAASLSRQPGAQLPWPHVVSCAHRGLSLRHSRVQQRCLRAPRAAHHGHGVRQRDGGEVVAAGTEDDRGADHAEEGWPQPSAASEDLARRLAASALSADVLAALAVPVSGLDADDRWPGGDGVAASGGAPAGPREPWRGHARLHGGGGAAGLPADLLRRGGEGLRHLRRPAAGRRELRTLVPLHHARDRPALRRSAGADRHWRSRCRRWFRGRTPATVRCRRCR